MRLDKSKLAEVKEKITAPVMVPVEINGSKFEVIVETKFSDTVRGKLGKTIELFTEENLKTYGTELVTTLLMLMSTTDIEWSFDLEEDMDTLTLLLNSGAAKLLLETIPVTLINEAIAYMQLIQETAEGILKEQKLENEKVQKNSIAKKSVPKE